MYFLRFCAYQKYVRCLWSISDTFCHDYGFKNARNRQISFRRIAAVVHFLFRVIFLVEPEYFEIMKSRKKRDNLHRPVYFLREGDHMKRVISRSNKSYNFENNQPYGPEDVPYARRTPRIRVCGHRNKSKNIKK